MVRRILMRVVTGAVVVTAAFFLVGTRVEDATGEWGKAEATEKRSAADRYCAWVGGIVRSGLTDWGRVTGRDAVSQVVLTQGPVTIRVGVAGFALGWIGAGLVAVPLALKAPRAARAVSAWLFPFAAAIPPAVIAVGGSVSVLFVGRWTEGGTAALREPMAAIVLGGLVGLSVFRLLLDGLLELMTKRFVDAARDRGHDDAELFRHFLLPHLIAATGLPAQAAILFAHCLVGSALIEAALGLNGLALAFVHALHDGQAELAATVTALFYVALAVGLEAAHAVTPEDSCS